MAQRRFQALQNDPNITRFEVEGTATGRQLGIGSYGSVEEVEVGGLICAGKKIHEALLDAGNVGVQEIASKYVQECQLMSDLRHPNITLFLGVCFLPNCQLPVLLMERLDRSLDDLLEIVPNIPLALKRSILEDVARGLLYLHKHTPQIIHRDLTGKNVLLTASLVAKITDFGNSRIVNLQPGQLARTLSQLPGTLVYMPPEALSASSRYGPSLDIFSFGQLALFTVTQVFPGDLLEPTYADPSNPERLIARSEVERRERFLEQLEREQHCCTQLIKDCLHNSPPRRPMAEQLLATLEGMRADVEGPCGAVTRADAVRQVVMMKVFMGTQAAMREQTNELTAKNEIIQQLHLQIQDMERRHQLQIQQKDIEHQQIITEMQEQLQVVEENHQAELRQRDVDIRRLEEELMRCQLQQNETPEIDLSTTVTNELPSYQIKRDSLHLQTPLAEPMLPLNLKWRKGKDLPFQIHGYPSVVIFKEKVCIAAGIGLSDGDKRRVVVYDPKQDSYDSLPPYTCMYFSMAVINDKLILVGGKNAHTHMTANKLGVWNEQSKRWTHTLPPMTTACHSPSVATHNNRWLVVIGGASDANTDLSRVEVLDTIESLQWYQAASLPQPCYRLSLTTIDNMCYLLGGFTKGVGASKKVLCACLDDLISQAVSQAVSTPSLWQSLPSMPLQYSTALAFNGALLAIGGDYLGSSAIHIYHPSSNSWVKARELPSKRCHSGCIILPGGEMLAAGGGDDAKIRQSVEIASR